MPLSTKQLKPILLQHIQRRWLGAKTPTTSDITRRCKKKDKATGNWIREFDWDSGCQFASHYAQVITDSTDEKIIGIDYVENPKPTSSSITNLKPSDFKYALSHEPEAGKNDTVQFYVCLSSFDWKDEEADYTEDLENLTENMEADLFFDFIESIILAAGIKMGYDGEWVWSTWGQGEEYPSQAKIDAFKEHMKSVGIKYEKLLNDYYSDMTRL
jgi:hypothetical protein